jgi:hypothetical protein
MNLEKQCSECVKHYVVSDIDLAPAKGTGRSSVLRLLSKYNFEELKRLCTEDNNNLYIHRISSFNGLITSLNLIN